MKHLTILMLLSILLIFGLLVGCLSLTTPKMDSGGEIVLKSPNGAMAEKIIFSSNRDGNYEIYMMDPDGSNQERLTNTPGDDLLPALSPDGTKITYASYCDGNREIFIMDVDGSNQRNLTKSLSNDTWPSFFLNGTKLAFSSNCDGDFDIYTMDIDGSNQVQLFNLPGGEYGPSFSPDDSKVTFYSDRYGRCDIFIINEDGTDEKKLTDSSGDDGDPDFSPDGTQIVFTDCNIYSKNIISIINTEDFSIITLPASSGNDEHPEFSPDGLQIVFSSSRDTSYYCEIYKMDVNGSNQMRLTHDSDYYNRHPCWGYVVLPPTEIPLDIKPGSCPNPLNVKSQGVLPVALLGTADFDVNLIDPASITLEGVSPLRWDYEDVSTPFDPYIGKEDCELDCSILGPDGILDLTFKFDTQEVLNTLGHIESYDIEEEDLEAFESGESDQLVTTTEDVLVDGACLTVTLTGTLTDGTDIIGEDLVLILRKGK